MISRTLFAALPLSLVVAGCAHSAAERRSPVTSPTLVARAVLPADSFAMGPPSGAAVKPAEAHGRSVPFPMQPVQGVSGLLANDDGTWLALADNGYGAKENSADFRLRVYRMRADFDHGSVAVLSFFELADPDRHVPFPILNEATGDRVLTGADFDPESIQRAPDGSLWIGDEFGPFLLHFDATGRLLDAPIPLTDFERPGHLLQSPQSPLLANGEQATEIARVKQSGGFEAMALTPDGHELWPILEKPLADSTTRELIAFRFDLESKRYLGEAFRFPLDPRATSVPDMQLLSKDTTLMLERDDSQGTLDGYKRVIRFARAADGKWTRSELVDLLKLHNAIAPITAGRSEGDLGLDEPFAMPFITIESLVIQDARHLLIANDNNYPYSVGRHLESNQPDDTELVLIELPQPL